jgi:hypothetical protein
MHDLQAADDNHRHHISHISLLTLLRRSNDCCHSTHGALLQVGKRQYPLGMLSNVIGRMLLLLGRSRNVQISHYAHASLSVNRSADRLLGRHPSRHPGQDASE